MRAAWTYVWMFVAACAFEPPRAAEVDPAGLDFAFPPLPPVEVEFGEDGLVIVDDVIAPGSHEQGRGIALLPNGGLAISVVSGKGDEIDSAIVRLSDAGGLLGTSIYSTSGDDFFEGIAADPDGSIYAAGATVFSDVQADLPVVKYRADGTLDPEFGENGRIFLPGLSERCSNESRAYQVAFSVTLDSEMRVLISGNATEADCVDRDMIVARLDRTTGALDPTFGGVGVVPARAPGSELEQSDNGQDVLQLPDGRIAVVGNTNRTGDFDTAGAVLWIHGDDGTEEMSAVFRDLDGSGRGSDTFSAVASDAEGRIVAVGRSYNGRDYDAVVVRFDASGQIDTTFAQNGVHVFRSPGDDRARGVVVEPSGRILIAGYVAKQGADEDLVVWALTEAGEPDPTWAKDGTMTRDFGSNERAEAIVLDARGRAFVTGSIMGPDGTWAVLVLRISS